MDMAIASNVSTVFPRPLFMSFAIVLILSVHLIVNGRSLHVLAKPRFAWGDEADSSQERAIVTPIRIRRVRPIVALIASNDC